MWEGDMDRESGVDRGKVLWIGQGCMDMEILYG